MPPVNTPTRSPASPPTPTHQAGRPLTPLSYLSSPAPDLASTLHTSAAAEQADEANVSFLRNSLEALDQASQQPPRRAHTETQRDPRLRNSQSDARATASQHRQETPEDLSRRERLQRVLARLNRLHESPASSAAAYSNRTPSPNRQSLYDWAPGYDESRQEEGELDAILRELRRQPTDALPDILRRLSPSHAERYLEGHADGSRSLEPDANASSATRTDTSDPERRLNRIRERERRHRESDWVSLRSRAVLQRARQEGAGSPSATERMLRYVMDRERSGMSEEEERARVTGWFRSNTTRSENEEQSGGASSAARGHLVLPPLPPPTSDLRERDRQERVDAFRRVYLAENVPPRLQRNATPPVPAATQRPTSSSSAFLENTLKYLSALRSCFRYEDTLSTAMDHWGATKEFFAEKHEDFIMDLSELPSLPHSSWLQPGAVFEGHQHATSGVNLTHHRQSSGSHVEQINPNYRPANTSSTSFDHPPGSTQITPFDATRPWQFTTPNSTASKEPHDHWPVRVIIHSVNAEKMTLQGTMEAYDVPQHPSSLSIINSTDRPKAGKKNAPITTYLEGHIIDLRTHSFLTPGSQDGKRAVSPETSPAHSFVSDTIHFPAASAHTDAQNWLKLPPFSTLTFHSPSPPSAPSSPGDVARLLLSKSQLQSLNEEYIFMRWKERCFIHSPNDPCSAPESDRSGDQDRGHGLTISGFYYISLRRSDGLVEGLYFDPTSTPFQHLRLKGAGSGWGAWEFR